MPSRCAGPSVKAALSRTGAPGCSDSLLSPPLAPAGQQPGSCHCAGHSEEEGPGNPSVSFLLKMFNYISFGTVQSLGSKKPQRTKSRGQSPLGRHPHHPQSALGGHPGGQCFQERAQTQRFHRLFLNQNDGPGSWRSTGGTKAALVSVARNPNLRLPCEF